jgi:hypothetical protein
VAFCGAGLHLLHLLHLPIISFELTILLPPFSCQLKKIMDKNSGQLISAAPSPPQKKLFWFLPEEGTEIVLAPLSPSQESKIFMEGEFAPVYLHWGR